METNKQHEFEVKSKAPHADVVVDDQGTIWMFWPVTEAAKQWVAENVQLESWQWMGERFGVDHRPARQLLQGMVEAGLTAQE